MLKPNLICSHKKNTAFPANIFMKLINIRHHYQHKAYTEFYQNQTINIEDVFEPAYIHTWCGYKIKGLNFFPLLSKLGNSELCVVLVCAPLLHSRLQFQGHAAKSLAVDFA